MNALPTSASDVTQIKQVIKINADKLIKIRDEHTNSEVGLSECRNLENKLIKYYSRIVLMTLIDDDNEDSESHIDFPQLLKVIGIETESIHVIAASSTFAEVFSLDDTRTVDFAQKHQLQREEMRRFCLFLHNLHRCIDDKRNNNEGENNYFWQSYIKTKKFHSTTSVDKLGLPRSHSCSLEPNNKLNKVNNKSQPNLQNIVTLDVINNQNSNSNSVQFSSIPRNSNSKGGRKKLRPSVLNIPQFFCPPSPAITSPGTMVHSIKHRFSSQSLLLSQNCDYCHKMMLFRYGVKCKECNYKCHKDCSLKAPASCGLPPQLEEFYKRTQTNKKSSTTSHIVTSTPSSPSYVQPMTTMSTPPLTPPASAPCSSIKNKKMSGYKTPVPQSSYISSKSISNSPQHFTFPDLEQIHPQLNEHDIRTTESITQGGVSTPITSPQQHHSKQITAMATVNLTPSVTSPSLDMEGVTMTIKPVFTMDEEYDGEDLSEQEPMITKHEDTIEPGQAGAMPTRKRFLRKSVLSDWCINFDELSIGKKIGEGRTGQVYEGKWHGDVAIKIYHIQQPSKEQLAQFRREVQMLRKVRHENIVLFMGMCMNPPNLCIVTEYLKGKTLHFYIHEKAKAYTERQSIQIMEQVSAALGYLHHRGIIHKNLKSKNIHMNDKKAVICDFGLGHMTDLKLKKGEKGFEVLFNVNLYYLAPEIIKKLQAVVSGKEKEDIELSESTDVYALGTVWYEILSGHWPWPGLSPEEVWWHLSKGLVPELSSSSSELSRLLLQCWSTDPSSRPNAAQLAKDIRSIPVPRLLQRSPSHPIGLRRTATS